MARKLALCALVTLVVAAAAACGPTPAPEIVEKVVTQVVEVQKEVTKIVEGTPVVETVVEVQVSTAYSCAGKQKVV